MDVVIAYVDGKEPIEKYDLVFGYDDDINYFIEQLRET